MKSEGVAEGASVVATGTLLIVGAGQAGSELALTSRQQGWVGPIVLLGDETSLPYQRPPLSKKYLTGGCDADALSLRPQASYDTAGVTLRLGTRLRHIHRERHEIELADGERLAYAKLALCTGGRARRLHCAGIDPEHPPSNLYVLRQRDDADALRATLQAGTRLVVIGGGYVGLEVAASARTLGAHVTLLEAQPRVLARVAGLALSAFCADVHTAAGVDLRTNVHVSGVTCASGGGARQHIVSVECADGSSVPADVVVAGLGMLPNVEAAREAGLAGEHGIEVDALSCTLDPDIMAAGDCTVQHQALYGRTMRLESVPNALEQARAAASFLCGKSKPNHSVPWFWSDQYDLKFQLAGLSHDHDQAIVRGDTATRSFCVFYLRGRRLLAVDAVNRPADFMLARRALAQMMDVDAAALADEAIPLRATLSVVAAVPARAN